MLAPNLLAVSGLLLTLVAAAPTSGVVGLENPQPLAERAVLKISKTPKKKSKEPDDDDYGNTWGAGGLPRPLPPPPSAPPIPNLRRPQGLKERSVEPLAERAVLKISKTPKKKGKEPDDDDYGNTWGAGGLPRPLPPPPSAPPIPNLRRPQGLKERSVETAPKDAGDVESLEKRGLLDGVLAAGLHTTSPKAKRDALFPESLEKRQNFIAGLRNAYKNWRARKQSPPGAAQPPRWVNFAGGDRVRRPGGF
ncbi:hypothetical protein HYFRA_00004254 [Hymenoscyphus fraxineus]|uniref:Uncharacterized protein n=1 Tax=Hymenoscyphus fraxineus TaxID=746836 RepID=A0A9N9PF47_9HELO|nr:hypothetical protein HYFRA_00004254 [Hymenoscyphus fraxineus]